MRLAVISDAHANLPALQAALAAIHADGCDVIVHTGDAIGIGPSPAECLALLRDTRGARCLMGNHEQWLIEGLPTPRPDWLRGDIVRHVEWTWEQVGPSMRAEVASWPYVTRESLEGVAVSFLHYAFDRSRGVFLDAAEGPTARELEATFAEETADLLFFGHDHRQVDVRGRQPQGARRYVNPGSLGCHAGIARYCQATFRKGRCRISHRQVTYDMDELLGLYSQQRVPHRAFICEFFFGRRLRA